MSAAPLTERAGGLLAVLSLPAGRSKEQVVEVALELLRDCLGEVKTGPPMNESDVLAALSLVERFQSEPSPGLAVHFIKEYGLRLIEAVRLSTH